MNKKADFAIGQIIQHRLFNYRGVIFDVDLSDDLENLFDVQRSKAERRFVEQQ